MSLELTQRFVYESDGNKFRTQIEKAETYLEKKKKKFGNLLEKKVKKQLKKIGLKYFFAAQSPN